MQLIYRMQQETKSSTDDNNLIAYDKYAVICYYAHPGPSEIKIQLGEQRAGRDGSVPRQQHEKEKGLSIFLQLLMYGVRYSQSRP